MALHYTELNQNQKRVLHLPISISICDKMFHSLLSISLSAGIEYLVLALVDTSVYVV